MFTITEYTMEEMKDPYKILSGQRYEFILDLDVEEDDELYDEQGVSLRAVFVKENEGSRMLSYEFLARASNAYIDMEMEEEELAMVEAFCKKALEEGETEQ
ncbi:DUF6509 family protein [Paenibacillus sp. HB172176]|uniref:DUF6509 family protein n=1 Tax=Paenibacillus sp. HB172176 TaxID=2493690 RepID=UPI00143AE7AD|nr:DUF6509 family protein [Paenibacillus sp. HB172176]